uniref:uncharacterized protein LOC120336143 n=1 Tax=Styela clava TaxID=7725 RepID=UPI00193A5C96|nr:uncharacterized protein LOC120336143 [Styela clava]
MSLPTLILFLVIYSSGVRGEYCYSITPQQLRGIEGEISYSGSSKSDYCTWLLPMNYNNGYILTLQIIEITMEDSNLDCTGNIILPGGKDGEATCEKSCRYYKPSNQIKCQNENPNLGNCKTYEVAEMPTKIEIIASKNVEKSFKMVYKYEQCGNTVTSNRIPPDSASRLPDTPPPEFQPFSSLRPIHSRKTTTTTPTTSISTRTTLRTMSAVKTTPQTIRKFTSRLRIDTELKTITFSPSFTIDEQTTTLFGNSITSDKRKIRTGVADTSDAQFEENSTTQFFPFVIVIIALSILIILAGIILIVGYFKFVRSHRVHETKFTTNRVAEYTNTTFAIESRTNGTATSKKLPETVNNVLYESY